MKSLMTIFHQIQDINKETEIIFKKARNARFLK
jgi:hypothetical protein